MLLKNQISGKFLDSVAAYLRGMRPTSPIDKDIPTINKKLKTQNYNINQTHK